MSDFFSEFFNDPVIQKALPEATIETLTMVGISAVVTVVVGLLLGIVLHVCAPGGLRPLPIFHRLLSEIIVNITRSIPFAILMVSLIPFTRLITGTSLGPIAASVSLSIGTIPFFARLVETALRDVNKGKIDAALVMGSTNYQVISKVMVREAMPSLVSGITTTVVTLVGYSAMAGLVGGGGLGKLAYNYGFQRFQPNVMWAVLVLIVILVIAIQLIGDFIARRTDHR